MNELQAHIEAENAKHKDSFFSVVSDPAHWAGYGIYTVAEYEHHMAVESYIDFFKEVNGIKPRWMDFSGVSTKEIYNMMDRLTAQWDGEKEWMTWCDEMSAEKEAFESKFADPEPNKYELLAEQAGY